MELLENHTYSTKEMHDFFGVTKDTWKKKKEDLLLHLQNYYEYEAVYNSDDRRKIDYRILKKIKDYEPLKGKRARQNIIYSRHIINVIESDNIQTAMNIKRIICNCEEIAALNHADGTIYEYTRVNMRTMFGKEIGEGGTNGIITAKIWCKLEPEDNFYTPLDTQQINYLYDSFSQLKKEMEKDRLALCADYDNGLLTKAEADKILGSDSLTCFLKTKKHFKNKYGYFPIKVPVYEISAFAYMD